MIFSQNVTEGSSFATTKVRLPSVAKNKKPSFMIYLRVLFNLYPVSGSLFLSSSITLL